MFGLSGLALMITGQSKPILSIIFACMSTVAVAIIAMIGTFENIFAKSPSCPYAGLKFFL